MVAVARQWVWGFTTKTLTLGDSFLTMGLHGDMGIQVVQSTVGLFTTVPAALVHALNLLVTTTWSLVLL